MATSYQDDYMKTALRLPRELHAKIQEAATKSGKSLNSELIERLEKSVVDGPDFSMFIAQLQFDAASQGLQAEILRAGFLELAQEVEVLLAKAIAVDVSPPLVSTRDRLRIRKLIDEARSEQPMRAPTAETLTRMRNASVALMDARYGFLEAKGAKNVRDAKV